MSITAPCVILVEPQLDQNIGKTARAMLNFGLTDLRLIRPKAPHNNKTARVLSAGAERVLENAMVYETLQEAAKELTFVLATTTRPREMIKDVYTPQKAMSLSRNHLAHHKDHRVGILFGPERSGLANDDISFCNAIITAPLNPDFSSLNLAQAVVIVAYEWFQSGISKAVENSKTIEKEGTIPTAAAAKAMATPAAATPAASTPVTATPTAAMAQPSSDPLASQEDLHGFLTHLETELEKSGYFRTRHMKEMMARNLRNMFARMPFTFQEIRSLRGVIASLVNPNGIYSRDTKCPDRKINKKE